MPSVLFLPDVDGKSPPPGPGPPGPGTSKEQTGKWTPKKSLVARSWKDVLGAENVANLASNGPKVASRSSRIRTFSQRDCTYDESVLEAGSSTFGSSTLGTWGKAKSSTFKSSTDSLAGGNSLSSSVGCTPETPRTYSASPSASAQLCSDLGSARRNSRGVSQDGRAATALGFGKPTHGVSQDGRASTSLGFGKHARRRDEPPAWSLRYAELVGMAGDDVSAGALSGRRPSRVQTQKQDGEALTSVFLAGNGRDKRLPQNQKMEMKRHKHTSRTVMRREGIWSANERLQAGAAVKCMCQYHPKHMRKLLRVCKMSDGPGMIPREEGKSLSTRDVNKISDETGMQDEDIQTLYMAFHRYDIDESGYLDRDEVRQVLADLGLQPRTREEKIEVAEIFCDQDLEGFGRHYFSGFLVLVNTVRVRLRELQFEECMILFEGADLDRDWRLDIKEVNNILRTKLNLGPENDDECNEITTTFGLLDSDSDGEVTFEEFQQLVQRIRARLLIMRREEELAIAKHFRLEADIFGEFRMDLPLIWSLFLRYDRSGDGIVMQKWLHSIFMDAGLSPANPQAGCARTQSVKQITDGPDHDSEFQFPMVLELMQRARRECMANMERELRERFRVLDRDRSGELTMREIYSVLGEFHMTPRSTAEQASIVQVIERIDTDGSGQLCFEEFQEFVQRNYEQTAISQRVSERQFCLSLGFSDRHIQDLRLHFFAANPAPDGRVGRLAVVQSAAKQPDFQWDQGRVREICRNAQQSPDRYVTFVEFMQTMQYLLAGHDEVQPYLSRSEGQHGPSPHGGASKGHHAGQEHHRSGADATGFQGVVYGK